MLSNNPVTFVDFRDFESAAKFETYAKAHGVETQDYGMKVKILSDYGMDEFLEVARRMNLAVGWIWFRRPIGCLVWKN